VSHAEHVTGDGRAHQPIRQKVCRTYARTLESRVCRVSLRRVRRRWREGRVRAKVLWRRLCPRLHVRERGRRYVRVHGSGGREGLRQPRLLRGLSLRRRHVQRLVRRLLRRVLRFRAVPRLPRRVPLRLRVWEQGACQAVRRMDTLRRPCGSAERPRRSPHVLR